MRTPAHARASVLLRPSDNLDGQCCCKYPAVLNLHHHIYTGLVLSNTACEGTITQTTRHCRRPNTSGYGGSRVPFNRRDIRGLEL